MRPNILRLARFCGLLAAISAQPAGAQEPGPAAPPVGELITRDFTGSQIFPGTTHTVTVYVPKQYDPAAPACVYVGQDGVQFDAPAHFDRLIATGEVPVLIGVFVRPGVVPTTDPNTALDRYNRSYEYDGLGDSYARFLTDELLPYVETLRTADGRPLHLSPAGNDRAIGGLSSGAIAAFTAAWERPEAFSRVFSAIGTYVDLRGGARYPSLIRQTEPKPLRVFLEDGSSDLNIYAGDWWMANQTMERALSYAGYEVNHAWGEGGHSGAHATTVFPDAMRWLWRDWPTPVKAGTLPLESSGQILIPGEGWELVGQGYALAEGAATNPAGEFFFTDIPARKAYTLDAAGRPVEFIADTRGGNGQAFGPDGRLYAAAGGSSQILAYDAQGRVDVVAEGLAGNDLVVAHNGNLYVTEPPAWNTNDASKVWLIHPDGSKQIVDRGLKYANGIALSPDQTLLYVADFRSHWVYSYVIQTDGTLAHKQRYYWLRVADTDDHASADGIKVDRAGRLYVATRLGIQVCDQAGRVQIILPTPNGRCTNLVLAGEHFDTLYATCYDKVYRRRLAVTGANAWDTPLRPPPPRL